METQQQQWTAVDAYFNGLLPADPTLDAALDRNAAAGLPAHDVAPNQAMLLHLLLQIAGAKSVLEIGTLGAYSTIWIARALPEGGSVITLEKNPAHAGVARTNLQEAGLEDMVDLRVGDAVDLLAAMISAGQGPFDFIFIDADKPNNPAYLQAALRLSRSGTVIVADNVVRDGKVADADSQDANVRGVREFTAAIQADGRLEATAIQTVGSKGYDGFLLARVR